MVGERFDNSSYKMAYIKLKLSPRHRNILMFLTQMGRNIVGVTTGNSMFFPWLSTKGDCMASISIYVMIFFNREKYLHLSNKKQNKHTRSYHEELLKNILFFYYLMVKLHVGKIEREIILGKT